MYCYYYILLSNRSFAPPCLVLIYCPLNSFNDSTEGSISFIIWLKSQVCC